MTVNARTFQILYIVRARALMNQMTALEDFTNFIASERKTAPGIYRRAYIAPSAMVPLLHRMTTKDNLLTLSNYEEYEFTPQGSQIADLLTGIDGCSSWFIDNYKEIVCQAMLQQRQRLGLGATHAREIAAVANISLDSARRGLSKLVEKGIVEEITSASGTREYIIVDVPTASKVETKDDVVAIGADVESQEAVVDSKLLADVEAAACIPLNDDDSEYDPVREIREALAKIQEALAKIDESETTPVQKLHVFWTKRGLVAVTPCRLPLGLPIPLVR